MVAAMHLPTNGWINNFVLVQRAEAFVDFFFVLSGFVIAFAYRNAIAQTGLTPFLLRRIGRLWPLHLVTLLATVAIAVAGSIFGMSLQAFIPSAIPANLMLIHGWGTVDRLSWNGPSWSISCEMFAYLLFALLASGLKGKTLDAACIAVLAASFATLAVVSPAFQPTFDWGVVRCLYGFMAGVLCARLWEVTAFRPKGEIIATLLVVGCVALLPELLTFLLVPVFAWAMLVFASDEGPLSRLLSRPAPQLLGRVSYSLYMTHYIIALTVIAAFSLLGYTADVGGAPTLVALAPLSDLVTLGYLATVVAVSCVTYALVEQPGRAWFNRRAQKRLPVAW